AIASGRTPRSPGRGVIHVAWRASGQRSSVALPPQGDTLRALRSGAVHPAAMVADVRIGRRDVRLTNLDKVFFPERGLTKGDLIRYYLDVAPHELHHVRNRPMQMKRYPNGVDGEFFYQKRVPVPHPDWLETVHIKFPSGRTADFPVCNDAASLAWIVNLGCIDLHTWHSRVADIERPDYLLIDLDPSEGNPWSH